MSAFARADSPGRAAAQPGDPSHPQAAVLEESRGWRSLGSPLRPCWRKLSLGVEIRSVGKPTQGGKTFHSWNLHFLTTANKEITPFSSLGVQGCEKSRIYTDVYKLNIEI